MLIGDGERTYYGGTSMISLSIADLCPSNPLCGSCSDVFRNG
jgi:hypothetical protein